MYIFTFLNLLVFMVKFKNIFVIKIYVLVCIYLRCIYIHLDTHTSAYFIESKKDISIFIVAYICKSQEFKFKFNLINLDQNS
jgi:hypothetical protein